MTPDVDALHPPLPRRVAERAVVLSAVLARAFIDQDVGNPKAERFRAELLAWLRDVGVEHEIEDGERALLTSQLGRVQPKVIVDATWQSEGLAVLAWALGRLALPAYDEPCDPKSAADAVGYLSTAEARALLESVELRPAPDLAKLGQVMFALHWRLEEFRLRRSAIDFATVARETWFGPLDLTGLRLVKGDLALRGTPIVRAPADLVRTCSSSARERHRAINWILGHHPVWSKTPTST